MQIARAGSQPSAKGPDDWFTGTVRIDPLFQAHPPGPSCGCGRDIRAYRVAHPSARPNADRDSRVRPRPARWYQAAIHQKAGRIHAAGITKDVVFEPVNGAINDRIDEAYRTEYAGSPYLKPMIGGRARAAAVRMMPRG
jgi:uncharacterized protein DUF2255